MTTNSIFIKHANLDDLSLDVMLNSPLMSPQVISECTKLEGKRKTQYVACRYLLATLLNTHFHCANLPTIVIGDNRRPYFLDKNLPDFNISHSKNFVAVALASKGKIGLDIELYRQRKNYLNITNQFFSPSERSWLILQHDQLDAFWQLWTLRESALKLYAKGVWQMKEIQIIMPQQQITAKFGEHFFVHHQQVDAIYLSICCNQPFQMVTINE